MTITFEKFVERVYNVHDSLIDLKENGLDSRKNSEKWSRKEILGHLIDSALNNYRRFILSYSQKTLTFDCYKQDDWVKAQNYNAMQWSDLIKLWLDLNMLIASLIKNIPDSFLDYHFEEHNLHSIGFNISDRKVSATLRIFISDYLDHIDHHLVQIKN